MDNNTSNKNIYVSVVVPVYNEEEILNVSVLDVMNFLDNTGLTYEIILAENGSTDNTKKIAQDLQKNFPGRIVYVTIGEPNYGLALKTAALKARGEIVLSDEIDVGDFDFYRKVLDIFKNDDGVDMVVGSKLLATSEDLRPWTRRFASRVMQLLLRLFWGLKGTETHGLKAWKRSKLERVLAKCVTDKDMFASEMIVRAERARVKIVEIPVRVEEKRAARIRLIKRLPNVMKSILKLTIILRTKP